LLPDSMVGCVGGARSHALSPAGAAEGYASRGRGPSARRRARLPVRGAARGGSGRGDREALSVADDARRGPRVPERLHGDRRAPRAGGRVADGGERDALASVRPLRVDPARGREDRGGDVVAVGVEIRTARRGRP